MGDRFVNSDSSLLLQDLLQSSEAVDHHHRVRVPQQAVQLVHHGSIWKNHEQEVCGPGARTLSVKTYLGTYTSTITELFVEVG